MESQHNGFSNHINGFTLYDDDILPIFNQNSEPANGYKFKNEQLDLSLLELPYTPPDPNHSSSSVSPDIPSQGDSPDEFNECLFNFIDQILDEEDEEGLQSLFCDPLELQATERSLYEALGEKYPSSSPSLSQPHTLSSNLETSEENPLPSFGENSTNSSPSYTFDSLPSVTQTQSLDYPSWSFTSNHVSNTMNQMLNTHMAHNIFTDSESIKQFNKGMEEASKFLPSTKPLVIDLDQYDLPQDSTDSPPPVVVKIEKEKSTSNGVKARKHHQLDDNGYEEERSSKQSAIYIEENELSEMFDRVLLATDTNCNSISNCEEAQQNVLVVNPNINNIPKGKKTTTKTVDISTLLVNCAQAVAAGDRRTATEQLHHIKQHASTSGDASQRLAHVFATGIEARLAGTGSQLYAAQTAVRISATEKLQAYQVYLSACPFKKIAFSFANKTICEAASKASIIHIVDFGIAYGFQWPIFIKHLSERPGGPPKLRITGIEFPQPGFRPAERLEETGRRLANYCDRFNVPFEYNAIASKKWETIKIEELKLQRHEFVAVNSLIRFHNLLDETVVVDSPRDKVLKLIREMKPDIFVHAVINGFYSAPFFVTRFKETLFHYSALFDMFDATIERGNYQRLNFEKEFYGREAMNVIACEGSERVERPESYKQWQVRISRAGFKMKPLNQELVKKLRCKRAAYHKDFVFDEDGKWILQGWKGRILYASSCWVPA
ncbi:hypothetical protein L2E82_20696 [Cichorium intybus]|uniref:Uncharacterized protein n=1 Tax=Cichorium intybus TaxID=13427 RepID=A0ACB9DUW6_CICIN|nr:hypothetical protein L2E82_20696 [Cichorium intybus]